MMRVGIASDHGGFALKEQVAEKLRGAGYEVVDFGAHQLDPGDDYPDFIIPMARAVAAKEVERGVALCGSGVGASIAANKVAGVRAGLIHDVFSAHQGVEDVDMNVFCLGGKVIGSALALELIETLLAAHFSGAYASVAEWLKCGRWRTRRSGRESFIRGELVDARRFTTPIGTVRRL
jgi:ribose 5-phosphate isomerase B